jgi:hypothetical protein
MKVALAKDSARMSARKWWNAFVAEIAARMYTPEKASYTLDG